MVPRRGRRLGLNFDVQAIPALYDGAQDPPLWVADRAPNLAYALSDIVLADRHVGPDGPRCAPASKEGRGISAAARPLLHCCRAARRGRPRTIRFRTGASPWRRTPRLLPSYRKAAGAAMRNHEVGSATLSFGAKYRESRAGRLAH